MTDYKQLCKDYLQGKIGVAEFLKWRTEVEQAAGKAAADLKADEIDAALCAAYDEIMAETTADKR